GEMTFIVDGTVSSAPAGSFVFVPRGVLHTFWNEGELPARQLTIFTPSGMEQYFGEAAAALASGGEDALSATMALMEKHDMIVPPDSRPAYSAFAREAQEGN